MRGDTPFGDTMNPDLVGVTCDGCGERFQTDETTAYRHDQRNEPLLCSRCENGGREAPLSRELENPQVDAVRDEWKGLVGPDAEPDISASLPDGLEFGELAGKNSVPLVVKKGTKTLGSVTVRPVAVDGLSLKVTISPGLAMLDDDVGEAIISALSRSTQLLIDVQ